MKWSILMPTVPARRELRSKILAQLEPQVAAYSDIELLVLEDNRKREYGPKMQALVDIAQGEYLCFVDDDDRVADDYVRKIREAMDQKADCIGFHAMCSLNGAPGKKVRYSMTTTQWSEDAEMYYRNPQHLTPIKSSLVRMIPWEGHYGADNIWSHKMTRSRLIKSETLLSDVLYFYDYSDDTRVGVWR